jgi:hypothetical protein
MQWTVHILSFWKTENYAVWNFWFNQSQQIILSAPNFYDLQFMNTCIRRQDLALAPFFGFNYRRTAFLKILQVKF